MAESTVLNVVLLLPLAGIAGLCLLSMSGTARAATARCAGRRWR